MTMSTRFVLAFTTLILTLGSNAPRADTVTTEQLEGAWELVSYRFSGGSPDVEGLQLMQDGRFSIVYSMKFPDVEESARSHAGTYRVQDGKIHYDVKWWVQKVGDECAIIPPTIESPAFEYDGDNLKLRFASGSSQHWRRISD